MNASKVVVERFDYNTDLRMGLIERHGHDWIVRRAGVGMSC